MSYSRVDENRSKAIEAYNEMKDYFREKARYCDLYCYDDEEGCGRCTYDSAMPECIYSGCKYLRNLVEQGTIR